VWGVRLSIESADHNRRITADCATFFRLMMDSVRREPAQGCRGCSPLADTDVLSYAQSGSEYLSDAVERYRLAVGQRPPKPFPAGGRFLYLGTESGR